MNFITTKAMQDLANMRNKPICGWIPKGVNLGFNELRWVHDPQGKVKEYRNPDPNFSDTDPWETTHSYKCLFRPNK